MFLRSGLDTTPEITRVMRERENAARALSYERYLAQKAAKKAASPGAKAHATMAAKKEKQLAAIAAKKEEALKRYSAAAPFNEFSRNYYDGLREAYNVAGAEMEEWFCVFKSLGCDHDKFMAYLRRDSPRIDWDRLIKSYWS